VGSNAVVSDNIVTGQGPVPYIAQNGIQFGYGSSGSAMKNTVTGNSYTGTSTDSGGIIVVGGAYYGSCPDGNPCAYTTGVQIVQNKVANNDIGVWLRLSNCRLSAGLIVIVRRAMASASWTRERSSASSAACGRVSDP